MIDISKLFIAVFVATSFFSSPGYAASDTGVGKGIIIPAYIGISPRDSTNSYYNSGLIATWTVLAEGAAIIKNGTSSYKDYWVVVNSGHNGPFDQSDNTNSWDWASSLWNPIRANGGKIFGYVHTTKSPEWPGVETYRSLDDVMADVEKWVKGYPDLDGIWIDEFYPRYEIANGAGTVFLPNGEEYVPTDRSWLVDGIPSWGIQIDPRGGYYDQLTKRIRNSYPNLKLIGNAGGWFWSNQKNYTDIVDVTCSFEQNLVYAMTSRQTGALDWTGLDRDNTWTTKGQLALIHQNSTDLVGAIDQAINKGYTHFYTTDRELGNNIWGGIPPYFISEVTYIANHP